MVGALVMVGKGLAEVEDITKSLEDPLNEQKVTFVPPLAEAKGLMLYNIIFEEKFISKDPIFLKEEDFMKGHKRRLEEAGIEYKLPGEENEDDIGDISLFD